jgi:hypothetical protein
MNQSIVYLKSKNEKKKKIVCIEDNTVLIFMSSKSRYR